MHSHSCRSPSSLDRSIRVYGRPTRTRPVGEPHIPGNAFTGDMQEHRLRSKRCDQCRGADWTSSASRGRNHTRPLPSQVIRDRVDPVNGWAQVHSRICRDRWRRIRGPDQILRSCDGLAAHYGYRCLARISTRHESHLGVKPGNLGITAIEWDAPFNGEDGHIKLRC